MYNNNNHNLNHNNNNHKLIIFSLIIILLSNNEILLINASESGSSSSSSDNNSIQNYYLNNICDFANSINDNDKFEMYYLQAPLMEAQYGNLFAKVNGYHSGIGLSSNNLNITADYYAGPTIFNSIFPINITKQNDNGSNDGDYIIEWDTYGIVAVTNQINSTYWNKRQLIMFDISGYQVKQYLSWIPIYNSTHPVYTFFNIQNPTTNQFYQNSSICDDFVWASFNTLYQYGGNLISIQSNPDRDEVTLYTDNEPIVVDQSNHTQMNQVANFYLNMEQIANLKNETFNDLIERLLGIFSGTFYLYNDGVYYKMFLTPNKPIDFSYQPSPMPSGLRNSSSIELLLNCIDYNNHNNSIFNRNKAIIISISIFISCISLFSIYITVGIIVNKIKGKNGIQLIPNLNLWRSIFRLNKNNNNINNNINNNRTPLLSDTDDLTIQ